MFDSLAEKLQATLSDVRARGTLTEDDINAAMREIRLALLEADVNFKVVKSFTELVKLRTTLKLTSASSNASRISRIAALMSSSVSVPRPRTSARVA